MTSLYLVKRAHTMMHSAESGKNVVRNVPAIALLDVLEVELELLVVLLVLLVLLVLVEVLEFVLVDTL